MNRWARLLGCAMVLATFAAVAATAGSASGRSHARCPAHAQIASLARWRHGGRLRADVDGDGRPDTVTVRVARWAAGRCAFYLAVSTASGVYTRALGPGTIQMSKDSVNVPMRRGYWSATFPKVEEIADLGGHGNAVVLSVGEGAANLGISFFGLSGGRIRFVRVGRALSIWPGGTVMDQEALTCSRGGPLRQLDFDNVATHKHPNRWSFSTVTYRRRGAGFVAVAHRVLHGSNAAMSAAAKRAGMPFRSLRGCSLARNPSLRYSGF
jgi:hypothetical protein